MTNDQLKELEDKLWDSANALRAYGGLKASDYAVPVLGLIFLKFADNKYSQYESEILEEYERTKGSRMERSIAQIAVARCGFYLPEKARFNYLLNLPGTIKMASALKHAMTAIEKYQDVKFQDVLPKEAYFDIEKKKDDILPDLLKAFSDIPQDASGDIFGKIYEYFLGKFALSEGQKGGEFFTPTSIVRFIVEVIEPFKGKIYDPACGSGGMFVQSADFVAHEGHNLNDIYVCGQEFMGETVRLAKMNLLVHNLRGEIQEVNSYEADPFKSYGKFDYVMANPPFNVKSVKENTVKDDKRFYEFGLPKTKGKGDKISDANYLWISLFATSLNENGRAGFVMANSASDAKHAEYEIRKKIVDSGIVDCMVSMPSNMFSTVTLPATLWFFDKQKIKTNRKDKILFLDARNVFNQIDRAHREWTPEQQQNLAAIVRLYRGEKERYLELISSYVEKAFEAIKNIAPIKANAEQQLDDLAKNLRDYVKETKHEKRTSAKKKVLSETDFFNKSENFKRTELKRDESFPSSQEISFHNCGLDNNRQLQAANDLELSMNKIHLQFKALKQDTDVLLNVYKNADKNLKLKNDKVWSLRIMARADKALEEALFSYQQAFEKARYWLRNIIWLQSRFPEAEYEDVTGLCKLADREEFVEEQDYSLNASRYVGVEIEDYNISSEEFYTILREKSEQIQKHNMASHNLEKIISQSIKEILNGMG